MNGKLPFEEAIEQKLADMPAPYADASWQKMSKLLDENSKRVAAPFFRSFKFWSFIAVSLLIAIGFFYHSGKGRGGDSSKDANKMNGVSKNVPPYFVTHPSNKSKPYAAQSSGTTQTDSNPDAGKNLPITGNNYKSATATAPEKMRHTVAEINGAQGTRNAVRASKFLKGSPLLIAAHTKAKATSTKKVIQDNNKPTEANTSFAQPQITSAETAATTSPKDEERKIAEAELLQPVDEKNSKPPEKQPSHRNSPLLKTPPAKKKYFLSAGVGLQHSIPVGGQQSIKYNYNGSTNTLSDYIPSAWIRFENRNRWFVQGEFIYASPQLVKAFAYSRQTQFNNISHDLTTTSLRLKKTYYNELPFSFNYYVSRNWSFGAGAIYSWFRSAIIEREVNTRNIRTQEQSVTKQIETITHYTDSFLYKSHTYVLLQTDYTWRKLNFGVRYTRDVQPYIKYTLPDGTKSDEKNWSLDLILRFRLWKSKGF